MAREYKKCAMCGVIKEKSEFGSHKQKHSLDGISSYCKPCSIQRGRDYYQKHYAKPKREFANKSYMQSYCNGKTVRKHRIIMQQYLGRELLSTELVHHKDGNKRNNDISNLELTTRKEHIKQHQLNKHNMKPVKQISMSGELIKIWDGAICIEEELGYYRSYICNCCKGKVKTAYGHIWKYA